MDVGTRLTVGQLAEAAGMTPKALRHYDQKGLFRADGIDDSNGYRWYRSERLPQARLVARLRGVGVPLDEVAECLEADGDPDVVDRVLRAHERRLEARLARVRGDLHRVTHLLADGQEDGVDATAGRELSAPRPAAEPPQMAGDQRKLAADLFNGVWTLMETEDRTSAEDDRMLHMAHASRYHWEQVGTAANLARGEWLCSRVYAVLRRPEPALHHARRVLALCTEHGLDDWDLAFAHEAIARGLALAGDPEGSAAEIRAAMAVPIADDEDRDLLERDLADIRP
jgi:DNA-binding transcriptional MerR regulator